MLTFEQCMTARPEYLRAISLLSGAPWSDRVNALEALMARELTEDADRRLHSELCPT